MTVEIRKRRGRYRVLYPDPAFAPCNCSPKCIAEADRGPKLLEAHSSAGTKREAEAIARFLFPRADVHFV